jgi:polysaccharide pyruvyl transferase WcaK-like protein
MAEVRIAKSLNIPVVFLSNSVGPMSNYDIYTRETLPQVDYIMVRDGKRFSWSLLNDYGVDRKINGPDDLFNACDKYGMLNNDKEDYVIIEIMAWIDRAPSGKNFVINILAQFIDYLIKVERKKVKLINFDKSDVIAKNAIRDVLNIVEEPQKITAVYEIDNMYEVFDLYKNCCYSLSFKYHPVILAVGAGKPCAAIITDDDGYYKSKLEGAFMNCGMDEKKHVMHIDALTYEKIIKMYLETQYDVCDERIRKELLHTRSTYLESINNEELFC